VGLEKCGRIQRLSVAIGIFDRDAEDFENDREKRRRGAVKIRAGIIFWI
jgi:hypothetical protein